MPQPELDGPEALQAEVRDLARRITRIEQELGIREPVVGQTPWSARDALVPHRTEAGPVETTAWFPVLGRALLGLAGAFLLRSVTESGTLPHRIGVAIGLLYAVAWLLWAARTPAARRVEAAIHSLTSALVLAPLLWEATLRFHAISTWAAGCLLLFFTLFGLAVSWRKDLLIVATIATMTGLGTAAALLIATHDVLPFTCVFLAIAAAVEVSACLDHWLSERWLAASAADLAVVLATWLVTNERGLPAAYLPIPHSWLLAAQVALLAIYLSSTIFRTLLRGAVFTTFEMVQCAAAFAISVAGGLRLSSHDPRLGAAMGLLTLVCGAACYVVSFLRLDREGAGHRRNFYAYSTFGMLLGLAGSRILLGDTAALVAWPAVAAACAWAGGVFKRLTLQVHGAIYLLLALALSGALAQAAAFVAAGANWPGADDEALAIGLMAAVACYVLAARYGRGREEWNFRALRLALAGMLAWLAAGLAAGAATAAYHAIGGPGASHAYCATLRTAVVAVAALLLAWGGSRWEIPELPQLIYPAMLLGAYRLLMLDLHQDRTPALFLSLLVYGGALMALPRLKRGLAHRALK
jgi:hypothetical protein